jgi:hypothetical protein
LDKTQLVETDIESGRRFAEALVASHVHVQGAMWFYDPKALEWWFLVITPQVDTIGPRAVYSQIQKVLSKLDPPAGVPFRTISALSPQAPLVKLLRMAIRTSGKVSGIRFTRNAINNVFIEDAYIYLLT